MLWYWAYMLRVWSDGPGSKYRRGLWAAAAAVADAADAEELRINDGGRRLLILLT